jgi:glycosyltransferase involved in cell wall biosynthesis
VRAGTLLYTVRSILAQTWPDWELIIIGQGPDPSLAAVGDEVVRMDGRIRYLALDTYGISRARNAGLSAATGEIVAMTDDDCEAAPRWLEALAELFARYPQVGLIGGQLVAPRVSRRRLGTCLSFQPADVLYDPVTMSAPPIGWGWIGANCALRRSVAERIGAFDECLGAGAPVFPVAEDTDYRLRLVAARVPMLSSSLPVVYHTYGTRYGVRQNLRNARSYARGNGGMDGKLTLLGDPHGAQSVRRVLPEGLTDAFRRRRLHRIPLVLHYSWHYRAAYRQCLEEFELDRAGCLQPKTAHA